ncbi:uncharacterized protein Bfra_000350 [Botrytis fragariae]|uniref:Uncharacterized protein n=1 Tax=Botrytis fragariae TaxID=1964551 RepID=A0A8H6B2X9_9HELO|nr:uncharacterized protein Bfra_000350 [Botrytis fragariae]KAF5878185.1 hypothetical protein Bfra_000350 [Botrytis fragariae]
MPSPSKALDRIFPVAPMVLVAGPRPPHDCFLFGGDPPSPMAHMFLRATSREVGESSLRGCTKATSHSGDKHEASICRQSLGYHQGLRVSRT